MPSACPSPVEFAIVGGGIAGLIAAYSLRQAGHKVLVLERRGPNLLTDGGLRIPPNMTRLLQTLPGATELLEKYGTQCSGTTFVDQETVEVLGRLTFSEEIMSDLGCHFYTLPYDTLFGYLLDICRQSGVELRFKVEIASVQLCSQRRPTVITTTGETIEADVLVGADGHNSIVRNGILQQERDEDDEDFDDSMSDNSSVASSQNFTEFVSATCTIPVSALNNDLELLELVDSKEHLIWPGTDLFLNSHRCGPELYIMSMVRTNGAGPTDVESDWHSGNSAAMSEEEKRSWDAQEPRVKRLISLARTWHRSIQRIPKICQLADPSTGLVLIGDAAHTVPIYCTHNASIATEDGFALGRIFSYLTSHDQIPALLQGYHATRYRRTTATEKSEFGAMATATLPPGPIRTARNTQFKAMSLLDDESEAVDEDVAAAWSTYLVQFDYDANEAVDEWWLNWGRLTQREEIVVE
ncbi:hypothetical protein C8R46DRAFT_1348368 [Mycena filopes]|nr:hypothetical protein C8R46DRAFT_1348368 [Mycena filopes]